MDEATSKLIEICSDVGNTLVNEINQRHKSAGQYVTGKTSAMLHIQPTEGGFRLIGWKYSGTYEEGRKPNAKPWGRSGSKSTDFSQALLAWASAKGITFKSEQQAQGWAYCVMRKMAQKGSQRYRNAQAGHPEDIFRTPIADMQERLMKQWMFYLSQQVKRELLRIDLKK